PGRLRHRQPVLGARREAVLGRPGHQSEASGDAAGKLGITQDSGILYYVGTVTWGLGWLPLAAAAGGAIGLLFRDRRLAAVLVPAPLLFLLFMGTQERFFAR